MYLLIRYKVGRSGERPPIKHQHFDDAVKASAEHDRVIRNRDVEKVFLFTDGRYAEIYGPQQ